MFGVPRVWEKIYAGVNAALGRRPGASQGSSTKASRPPSPIVEPSTAGTRHRGAARHVGRSSTPSPSRTVRELIGLDAAASSPSPARRRSRAEILEWFRAIGVPLSEIYGMSRDDRAR